ncbi:hypothetical protein NDU88_002234 [Pleurodeles waltl]|uniref:Uncharacterized protein n=1 Tax=Pleurodeles waltl TaxID=8319 RepID=A0AAV7RAS4_PLEWA|nr:hypothetical protein NDU88_002234 [Pleurodeles waltl]
MNAVSVGDRMGAQAVIAHVQAVCGSKQAQPPLEKGGELMAVGGKERPLGGTSKMAASSDADSGKGGMLEERTLGATSKMAAPININEEEVVIISDEEEEVQSLPVKVRAPLIHRAEGRVKPGAVYPTSRELAGVGLLSQRSGLEDVQPSTSQGAGGGLYPIEEELLDYDDDVEEEVLPMQQGDVVKSRDVPRVVQGDHSGAHRQELVAGNLPRGEERVLGSSGSKVVRDVMDGMLQKGVQGDLHEQTLSKVDAPIQSVVLKLRPAASAPTLHLLWPADLPSTSLCKVHSPRLLRDPLMMCAPRVSDVENRTKSMQDYH